MTRNQRLGLECGILTGAAIFALMSLPLPVYKTDQPIKEEIEHAPEPERGEAPQIGLDKPN